MSRFSGWDEKAVAKLSGKITNTKTETNYANKNALKLCSGTSQDLVPCERTKVPRRRSVQLSADPVAVIQRSIESSLLGECVREYKFLHDRRFRFDLAIPKHKIAIEFEGGVWTHGRHTRGKGYVNDCKKYNLAVMHGWKLLRYTVEDTKKINWELAVVEEVRKLINLSEDV